MARSDTFLEVLKDNDVRLVTCVPDNVLTPLIGRAFGQPLHADLRHPRGRGHRHGRTSRGGALDA
jgi:hypothetical protein